MGNHLCDKLKTEIWKQSHIMWESKLRQRFNNSDVTIISPNCTGGLMYHDLGLQFLSPTINLFIKAQDYLMFVENLSHYVYSEMKLYSGKEKRDYPLADLDGLTLYLVHYKSIEEAKQKWEQRVKRINWNKITVLGTDRDGMTLELMERFDSLPYHKIMFVKDTPTYSWQVQIHGCVEETQVGTILQPDISSWSAAFHGKRYYDQFDWVDFLNAEVIN